eukprot:SAG22_NODE_1083_length_5646_cov_8.060934_4_plen_104_part_00
MGDSFGRVKAEEEIAILEQQANLIVTMEILYPEKHRYAQYMHVLVPKDDSGTLSEWKGREQMIIASTIEGVQHSLKAETKRLTDRFAAIETRLEAIEHRLPAP